MCKVFMIAGIKKQHQVKVTKLVKEMAKGMSKAEPDGLGYAAITGEGKIYGEKWVHNEDAFLKHKSRDMDPVALRMQDIFGKAATFDSPLSAEPTYGTFGDLGLRKDTVAMILHARNNTVGRKCVENTHPFVSLNQEDLPDTALIHNGTIKNHEKLTKKYSTCDSETILHEYLDHWTFSNPWAIENIAKRLRGEYAVGVLSSEIDQNGASTPIMDVFKSNKPLYTAWIKELETFVFSTSDTVLNEAAKNAGFTVSSLMKVADGHFMRFNAITGERANEFIPFELSYQYEHGNNYLPAVKRGGDNVTQLPVKNLESEVIQTINSAKQDFVANHPELFNQPYYGTDGKLNEQEKAFLLEIDKDSKVNHKALQLVNAVLNLKGG